MPTPIVLGPRARKLLFYMALGRSTDEIATQLEIKRATVKVHIRKIFRKLEVSDRVQAVLVARSLGLVPAVPGRLPRIRNIHLSPDEKRMLSLAARGLSYPEIAGEMGCTARQVKYYMTRLYPKLGVSRRELAVLKALHLGLIREPDPAMPVAAART